MHKVCTSSSYSHVKLNQIANTKGQNYTELTTELQNGRPAAVFEHRKIVRLR